MTSALLILSNTLVPEATNIPVLIKTYMVMGPLSRYIGRGLKLKISYFVKINLTKYFSSNYSFAHHKSIEWLSLFVKNVHKCIFWNLNVYRQNGRPVSRSPVKLAPILTGYIYNGVAISKHHLYEWWMVARLFL